MAAAVTRVRGGGGLDQADGGEGEEQGSDS